MSRDTGGSIQLQIITDDAADRRLADRLVRARLSVAAVPHDTLGEPVRGNIYVATGVRAAADDLQLVVRAGAHVLLVPPFPDQPPPPMDSALTFSPAGRHDGVYLSQPVVAAAGSSAILGRPLRVLYRNRIAGGVNVCLVESADGEMLAGAMARTSNLYGQLVVSTLMLGIASAQTNLDDVTTLVRSLVSWCTATEGLPEGIPLAPQEPANLSVTSERDAQFVLLALAISEASPGAASLTATTLASIRPVFERVAARLRETPDAQTLANGWEWLRVHGVLAATDDDASLSPEDLVRVDVAAMHMFVSQWQLQPRLRRLIPHVTPHD